MSPLTNSWNWSEVARVSVNNGDLQVTLGPTLICIVLTGFILWALWRWKFSGKPFRHYQIVEAELTVANIGKVKIQPNDEIARIAYQAWVELSTRKIGLAFNEAHDVIPEIYASWYETFGRLRDLAKTIPARRIQTSKDTRNLVDLMVRVLNDGLRPHLTTWQARFRRWYEAESKKEETANLSPQEIQRRFPDYKQLIADLIRVQAQIVQYRDFLWMIAKGAGQPRARDAFRDETNTST